MRFQQAAEHSHGKINADCYALPIWAQNNDEKISQNQFACHAY